VSQDNELMLTIVSQANQIRHLGEQLGVVSQAMQTQQQQHAEAIKAKDAEIARLRATSPPLPAPPGPIDTEGGAPD
jgi:hypothetical protein